MHVVIKEIINMCTKLKGKTLDIDIKSLLVCAFDEYVLYPRVCMCQWG